MLMCSVKCHNVAEELFLVAFEFCNKLSQAKRSIVNSVAVHEAHLTQKSLSNQTASCWFTLVEPDAKSSCGNLSCSQEISDRMVSWILPNSGGRTITMCYYTTMN